MPPFFQVLMQMPGMKLAISLAFRKSCTVETVEKTHIQGVTLTYRGPSPGQAKRTWGLLGVLCVLCVHICRICRYSAGRIVNGLFVDVHVEIGHSHPCFMEAMTFPSCRGSAYVTAESGVLKFHQVQRNNSGQSWFQKLDKTYYQVTMDGAWGKGPIINQCI